MTGDLFEDTVKRIDQFYKDHDYRLEWRFLTCSRKVLDGNPKIALITLNPGGEEQRPDHPQDSCEEGCAYLVESWKNGKSPGEAPLQIQVRRMFAELAEKLHYQGTPEGLLEESLSGYFIPFRSPSFNELEHRSEALDFGESIWSSILESVRPGLIICIDTKTYERLKELIPRTYRLRETNHIPIKTGWGNTEIDILEFGESSEARLLRLPHLSTYKLFSRAECVEPVDRIFTRFCGRES